MLLTIKQFSELHKWPTAPAIRAMIFKRKVSKSIVRVGRRVLIEEDEFFEELRENYRRGL